MTTTAEIIAGFYNLEGITTESALNVLSVGSGVSQVALNDPTRLSILFINISSDIIYLGYDSSVSSASGILLVPNGGSFSLELTTDFALTGYATNAVSTGTDSALMILTTSINN